MRKSIEQMCRDLLEAVANDRELVRDLWLRRDPQTMSAGDLVFPANKLRDLIKEMQDEDSNNRSENC